MATTEGSITPVFMIFGRAYVGWVLAWRLREATNWMRKVPR